MYDFPASPAPGDVSNGYVWNGELWAGAPAMATDKTEQFFNIGGAAQFDIDVPAWAKMATFEGTLFHANSTAYTIMSVSTDGTTFIGGTVHSLAGGTVHKVTGGYSTQGAVNANGYYLSMPASNLNVAQIFNATLNLETGGTGSQVFVCRSEFQFYDNTSGGNQYVWQSYLNVVNPVGTRIKKLRLLTTGGAGNWPAGSWFKVKWAGDPAQALIGNTFPDAPSDGCEYTRCNGVWRLKRQEYVWGATNAAPDIIVPTSWNPRRCTLNVHVGRSVATIGGIGLRASQDGVTFPAGASDYYYAGLHGQGSTPYMQVSGAYSLGYLSFTGDNVSVGGQCTAEIELDRLPNSVFQYRSVWSMYHNTAGVGQRDGIMTGYLSGGFTGPRLKALRVFLDAGTSSGGYISAEWS